MPGVLAAGDVRRGSVKRVASAVGEGSILAVSNLLVATGAWRAGHIIIPVVALVLLVVAIGLWLRAT